QRMMKEDELVEDNESADDGDDDDGDSEDEDDEEDESSDDETNARVKEKEREDEKLETANYYGWETPQRCRVQPKKQRTLPGSELLEGNMAKGKFPNFFSANFWGTALIWGGPVWVADTTICEAKIRIIKEWMKRTN